MGPGKWTVEAIGHEPHQHSAAFEGPSLRDLIGGDLDLSMEGQVTFGPDQLSPRKDPPTYGRK